MEFTLEEEVVYAAYLHRVSSEKEIKRMLKGLGVDKLKTERIIGYIRTFTKLSRLPYGLNYKDETAVESRTNLFVKLSETIQGLYLGLADKFISITAYTGKKDLLEEVAGIYAPLAERWGLDKLSGDFLDEVFRNYASHTYNIIEKEIETIIGRSRADAKKYLNDLSTDIKNGLAKDGMDAIVLSRVKSAITSWLKINRDDKKYTEIAALPDLLGITVIVENDVDVHGAVYHIGKILKAKLNVEIDAGNIDRKDIELESGYVIPGQKYHIDFKDDLGVKHEVQIYSQKTYKEMRLGKMAHWSHKLQKIDALKNQKFEVIPGLDKAENPAEIFSVILSHINKYKYINVVKLGKNIKAPVVIKTLQLPPESKIDSIAVALNVDESQVSVCPIGRYSSDSQGDLAMACSFKRGGEYLIKDGDLLIILDKDRKSIPRTIPLVHNNKIFGNISFGSSPIKTLVEFDKYIDRIQDAIDLLTKPTIRNILSRNNSYLLRELSKALNQAVVQRNELARLSRPFFISKEKALSNKSSSPTMKLLSNDYSRLRHLLLTPADNLFEKRNYKEALKYYREAQTLLENTGDNYKEMKGNIEARIKECEKCSNSPKAGSQLKMIIAAIRIFDNYSNDYRITVYLTGGFALNLIQGSIASTKDVDFAISFSGKLSLEEAAIFERISRELRATDSKIHLANLYPYGRIYKTNEVGVIVDTSGIRGSNVYDRLSPGKREKSVLIVVDDNFKIFINRLSAQGISSPLTRRSVLTRALLENDINDIQRLIDTLTDNKINMPLKERFLSLSILSRALRLANELDRKLFRSSSAVNSPIFIFEKKRLLQEKEKVKFSSSPITSNEEEKWYNRRVRLVQPERYIEYITINHKEIDELICDEKTREALVKKYPHFKKIDFNNICDFNIKDYVKALKLGYEFMLKTPLEEEDLYYFLWEFHDTIERFTPGYHQRALKEVKKLYNRILSEEFNDPIEFAAEVFIEFVRIHPFQNGNHRTADILLNFILHKKSMATFYLISSNVIEYYRLLNTRDLMDSNYDLKAITEFFRNETIKAFEVGAIELVGSSPIGLKSLGAAVAMVGRQASSPVSKIAETMLKEDVKGLLKELQDSLLAKDDPKQLIRLLVQCDKAVREGIEVDMKSKKLQDEVAVRARKMWLIDGGYENESKESQDRRYALAAADILAVYSAKAHIAPLESRWPVLKAVTLLNKDEEDALLKHLRVAVGKRSLLRKIPLIDFMLLMLGDVPNDWALNLVPHLIGKTIFILSPEGRKVWKGGLGPVITFHGDAMQRLLDGYARVIHVEADYQYIRDKTGSLRDLHFEKNTPFEKNTSTEILDVERLPEADFSMRFGQCEGDIVKVEARHGRSPKGAEVAFLRHMPEYGANSYTKVLYDYEAPDNPVSWWEFSRFYDLASLRFIAWFVMHYNINYKDVVILANDSQSATVNVFISISDDGDNNGLLKWAIPDLLPTIIGLKQYALPGMITHTYINRMYLENTPRNRQTLKWFTGIRSDELLNKLFLRQDDCKKEWLDIATGGLRTAKLRAAVAAKHARDIMRLFDRGLNVVGITNGTDLEWLGKPLQGYVRELVKEGVFEKDEVDLHRPTPIQVLKIGEKAKKKFLDALINEEARVRAYERWEKEGSNPEVDPMAAINRYFKVKQEIEHGYRETLALDPYKLTLGTVLRLVWEKFNMGRAWSEENITTWITAAADILIAGTILDTDKGSLKIADCLRKLQAQLLEGKRDGDGNLVFLGSFDSDVKKAALLALSILFLDSNEDSEASGLTEVLATQGGALVLGPPYRNGEGTIISQGISDNTLIPENCSPEAYRKVIMDAIEQWRYNRLEFGERQAISMRLSRIHNAFLPGATYLKALEGLLSTKEASVKSSSPVVTSSLDVNNWPLRDKRISRQPSVAGGGGSFPQRPSSSPVSLASENLISALISSKFDREGKLAGLEVRFIDYKSKLPIKASPRPGASLLYDLIDPAVVETKLTKGREQGVLLYKIERPPFHPALCFFRVAEGSDDLIDTERGEGKVVPYGWLLRPYAGIVVEWSKDDAKIIECLLDLSPLRSEERKEQAIKGLVDFCETAGNEEKMLELLLEAAPLDQAAFYPAMGELLLRLKEKWGYQPAVHLQKLFRGDSLKEKVAAVRRLGELSMEESWDFLFELYNDSSLEGVTVSLQKLGIRPVFFPKKEKGRTTLRQIIREALKTLKLKQLRAIESYLEQGGLVGQKEGDVLLDALNNKILSETVCREAEKIIISFPGAAREAAAVKIESQIANLKDIKENLGEAYISKSIREYLNNIFQQEPQLFFRLKPEFLSSHLGFEKPAFEILGQAQDFLIERLSIDSQEALKEIIYLFERYGLDIPRLYAEGNEEGILEFYKKQDDLREFGYSVSTRLFADIFADDIKKYGFSKKRFLQIKAFLLEVFSINEKQWQAIPHREFQKLVRYLGVNRIISLRKRQGELNEFYVSNLGSHYRFLPGGIKDGHLKVQLERNQFTVSFGESKITILQERDILAEIRWEERSGRIILEAPEVFLGHTQIREELRLGYMLINIALDYLINVKERRLEELVFSEVSELAEITMLRRFGFRPVVSLSRLFRILSKKNISVEVGFGGPAMNEPYLQLKTGEKGIYKLFFVYPDDTPTGGYVEAIMLPPSDLGATITSVKKEKRGGKWRLDWHTSV